MHGDELDGRRCSTGRVVGRCSTGGFPVAVAQHPNVRRQRRSCEKTDGCAELRPFSQQRCGEREMPRERVRWGRGQHASVRQDYRWTADAGSIPAASTLTRVVTETAPIMGLFRFGQELYSIPSIPSIRIFLPAALAAQIRPKRCESAQTDASACAEVSFRIG
jgi:hypothetical protein